MNLPTVITLIIVAAVIGLALYASFRRRGCCKKCSGECSCCQDEHCSCNKQ